MFKIILIAILLITIPVMAATDQMMQGELLAFGTTISKIRLEPGDQVIEIYSPNQLGSFDCVYFIYNKVYSESNVPRCRIRLNYNQSMIVSIFITNRLKKKINYIIWTHDSG